MSMTMVVTRNVSDRMRGFLASSMLELSAGTYTAPRISPAVRDRIWSVLRDWFTAERDASVIMLWYDPSVPGQQAIRTLGLPPVEVVEVDGMLLARRELGPDDSRAL